MTRKGAPEIPFLKILQGGRPRSLDEEFPRRSKARLEKIQGGRQKKSVRTVSSHALERALVKQGQRRNAIEFLRDAIYHAIWFGPGTYRAERLYGDGDVSVSYEHQAYILSVRYKEPGAKGVHRIIEPNFDRAVLDFLSFWEHAPHLGPVKLG